MIFRNFYRLKIVCMMQFMVKSVKIMYYAQSGALWVIYRLVIDYGYCLDLLTISFENSRVFCFPSELRFILLQNIMDISVFLCC